VVSLRIIPIERG